MIHSESYRISSAWKQLTLTFYSFFLFNFVLIFHSYFIFIHFFFKFTSLEILVPLKPFNFNFVVHVTITIKSFLLCSILFLPFLHFLYTSVVTILGSNAPFKWPKILSWNIWKDVTWNIFNCRPRGVLPILVIITIQFFFLDSLCNPKIAKLLVWNCSLLTFWNVDLQRVP